MLSKTAASFEVNEAMNGAYVETMAEKHARMKTCALMLRPATLFHLLEREEKLSCLREAQL